MEREVKTKIITNMVTAVRQTEDNRIFIHQTSLQKGKAPKEVITVIKPEEAKTLLDALFFSQRTIDTPKTVKHKPTPRETENQGSFEYNPKDGIPGLEEKAPNIQELLGKLNPYSAIDRMSRTIDEIKRSEETITPKHRAFTAEEVLTFERKENKIYIVLKDKAGQECRLLGVWRFGAILNFQMDETQQPTIKHVSFTDLLDYTYQGEPFGVKL